MFDPPPPPSMTLFFLDPPFYDIIFSWSPLFSQLFLLDPSPPFPPAPPPPRELKNDDSLNDRTKSNFGSSRRNTYLEKSGNSK